MRPALVVAAIAGCSGGAPSPISGAGSGSAAPVAPVVMQATARLDLTGPAGTDAFKLGGIRLMPLGGDPGVFDVQYAPSGPKRQVVRSRTTCRVGEHNVTVDDPNGPYPTSGGVAVAVWRPDPFHGVPAACQLDFFAGASADHAPSAPIASACWTRDGSDALAAGACPASSLPPPRLPAGATLALESASYGFDANVVTVAALVTVGAALPPDRRYQLAARCDEAGQVVAARAGVASVRLGALPAGASAQAVFSFVLEGDAEIPAGTRCELVITSRARTGPPAEQPAALYCATGGHVLAGACAPAIGQL